MSKQHIHIHTAHEEALKHQAGESKGLAQWVAILSALLACFAAVVRYQNASREGEVVLHENEAIIKTAQATDMWALY